MNRTSAFLVGAVIGGVVGVGVLGAVWVIFMVVTDGNYEGSKDYTTSTCEEAVPDDALADLGFDTDSVTMTGGYGSCHYNDSEGSSISVNVREGTNYRDRTDQNEVRSLADTLDRCGAPPTSVVQREYNPDWLDLPKGVLSCASMGDDEFRGRAIAVEVQSEREASLTIEIQQPSESVSGEDWKEPTAAIVASSREVL